MARAAATRTTKDERAESARALKAAKKANAEARKLASSLPQPTRGKLETYRRTAGTSRDPKARAGSIKRQRVQTKQSQAMPTKAAIRTLITAFLTPTDSKQREKVAKRRVRRMKQQSR